MCQESFDVFGLSDQRTAYEVEEYLSGIPNIYHVHADVIEGEVVIQWDETQLREERILDHIEHAGCKPDERVDGVIDHFKAKFRL